MRGCTHVFLAVCSGRISAQHREAWEKVYVRAVLAVAVLMLLLPAVVVVVSAVLGRDQASAHALEMAAQKHAGQLTFAASVPSSLQYSLPACIPAGT